MSAVTAVLPARTSTASTASTASTPSTEFAGAQERVALGLLAASVAVFSGVVVALVTWRFGFVTSLASAGTSYAAVRLYGLAAGGRPRRGRLALAALIAVGVLASFLAVTAVGWWTAYGSQLAGPSPTVGRMDYVWSGLTDAALGPIYAANLAMFAAFAFSGVVVATVVRPASLAR